jgi:HD-GYP domain-containing protein (c-di-GMP phosphodiesterase class II)
MPVLRSGAVLTEAYQLALTGLGINAVWVQDELSEGIEPVELVPPQLREEAARSVSGALAEARNGLSRGRGLSSGTAAELKSMVKRLSESVAESPPAALVLADLAAADAFTHQHSIDVCALGLLVGRRLFERRGWEDFRGRRRRDDVEARLLKLGLGLLLHDVGKLAVPASILEKPGALTPEERVVVQTHPDAGAELLDSAKFSPLVRAIVREHHERWDGRGYPRRLGGTQITELARICAVADVYDAVTSERPYKPARTPADGLAAIVGGSGTAFDPDVVAVFRRLVAPFPVGSEVTLPDGTVGVVADVLPDRPACPVVRLPRSGGGYVEERVALAA